MIDITFASLKDRVNNVLADYLPSANLQPQQLHRAMRYSVLNGGKRIRPLLVYGVGTTFNIDPKLLDAPAAAIELIHCYSLVHDDLPAMDNDDIRRGQPTCHKAFNEATAILTGDALFNLAIQILATNNRLSPATNIEILSALTNASSSLGMAGGQAIDLESINKQLTLDQLENMHNLKTGALIRAAVKLGTLAAKNINKQQLEILDKYATCIGLAFQIKDDIADRSEIDDNKANYVSLLGLTAAKKRLQILHEEAVQYLRDLSVNTDTLNSLTKFIF